MNYRRGGHGSLCPPDDFVAPTCRYQPKSAACKLLVKILRLRLLGVNDRPRRTTAGEAGRQPEQKAEATRGS
jgi:hypothetical protein